MASWIPSFTWIYGQQQEDKPATTNVSGMMGARVYIAELKARLQKDFRAQRAECCLDFNDADHCAAFLKHREALVQNVMNTDRERSLHKSGGDALEHQRLLLRQERLINDLDIELQLQKDYKCTTMLAVQAKSKKLDSR